MLNHYLNDQIGILVTAGIYNLFLWPGLFFFILRRNHEPIKSRGFKLAIIQMLLGEVVMIFALLGDEVSCFFRPAALLLIVPFVCVPYVIRGAVLYHRYILHNGMKIWAGRHKSTSLSSVDSDAEMFLKSLSEKRGTSEKGGTGNGSEHEEGSQTGSHRKGEKEGKEKDKDKEKKRTVSNKRKDGEVLLKAIGLTKKEENPRESADQKAEGPISAASSPAPADQDPSRPSENQIAAENAEAAGEVISPRTGKPLLPEEQRKQDFSLDIKLDKNFIWAVKNKKWFQDRYLIPLSGVVSGVYVIVLLLIYFLAEFSWSDEKRNDFSEDLHNRCFKKGHIAFLLAEFLSAAVPISIVAYLLLGVREAFKVRIELMMVVLTGSAGFILCLVSIFGDFFPPALNYAFFGCLGTVAFSCITLVYPVIESYKFQAIEREEKPDTTDPEKTGGSEGSRERTTSNASEERERKKKRSRNIDDDEIMKIIFEEPELLKGFEEFAVSTWCMENVLFYKRVQQFKACSENRLNFEGKKIWKFHFERGCDFEINVDAPVREKIMEMVKQDVFQRDMFHEAEKMVFVMLRYNIYPLWKASSAYKDILDKMGSPDIKSVRGKKRAVKKTVSPNASSNGAQ